MTWGWTLPREVARLHTCEEVAIQQVGSSLVRFLHMKEVKDTEHPLRYFCVYIIDGRPKFMSALSTEDAARGMFEVLRKKRANTTYRGKQWVVVNETNTTDFEALLYPVGAPAPLETLVAETSVIAQEKLIELKEAGIAVSLAKLAENGKATFYIGGDTYNTFDDEWIKSVAHNGGAAMLDEMLEMGLLEVSPTRVEFG
eukprot:COSAG04_NODE_1843_length_5419_cov_7.115226_4_plen_199_part_00